MNITSKVHKFVEFAEKHNLTVFDMSARQWVSEAIIFDCGEVSNLPPPRTDSLPHLIKPPFKKTIIQLHGCNGHELLLIEDAPLTRGFYIKVIFIKNDGAIGISPDTLYRLADNNKIFKMSILVDQMSQKAISDSNSTAALTELIDASAQWAAHIFRLLRCKNVGTVDNPAPAALNKKRTAAGKVPIFSHKTLHLQVPAEYQKNPHQGGTHASPRIHLRRGHIRTISGDRELWIEETTVGKKHGIVHKDYQLH